MYATLSRGQASDATRALVYYTSDDESTTAKFRRRRRRILAGRASLIGRLIAHGTAMQVKRRATQVRRVARAPELRKGTRRGSVQFLAVCSADLYNYIGC